MQKAAGFYFSNQTSFILPCFPTYEPETDAIVQTLRTTGLATPFATPSATNVGGIATQLKLIAKLIAIRNDRGNSINRDVFYCEMGGEFSYVST